MTSPDRRSLLERMATARRSEIALKEAELRVSSAELAFILIQLAELVDEQPEVAE